MEACVWVKLTANAFYNIKVQSARLFAFPAKEGRKQRRVKANFPGNDIHQTLHRILVGRGSMVRKLELAPQSQQMGDFVPARKRSSRFFLPSTIDYLHIFILSFSV